MKAPILLAAATAAAAAVTVRVSMRRARPVLSQQLFDRLTALGRSAARQFNQLQPTGRAESS